MSATAYDGYTLCEDCGEYVPGDPVLHKIRSHEESFARWLTDVVDRIVRREHEHPEAKPVAKSTERVFTVPVAFDVRAINEEEAASLLVHLLDSKGFTDTNGPNFLVESWRLPNHHWADGTDKDCPQLHWSNECREVSDALARHDCTSEQTKTVLDTPLTAIQYISRRIASMLARDGSPSLVSDDVLTDIISDAYTLALRQRDEAD